MSQAVTQTRPNVLIASWGILGFGALLVRAIWKLWPLAYTPIRDHMMSTGQIALWVAWVAWMWYSEGYKTFQKIVSPRVVARGMWLGRNPKPLLVALAPFFCMGLFHATRRRIITAWIVVLMIVGLIVSVHFLPQPWRGIVNGGVVVGLGWGLGTLLLYFGRALAGSEPGVDPELPASVASAT